MNSTDAAAWHNSRPKKRMGAGALIMDTRGRVLLVEPTYQDTWQIPGGSVEADESPRETCTREVVEELGIAHPIGRLLCLDWQAPRDGRVESLAFLYDGGILPDPSAIRLPPGELASWQYASPDDLDRFLVDRLARRVRAAITARDDGTVAELHDSHHLDPQ